MQCTYEFSRGYGTGVSEAIGNWGFSNGIASHGNELQRMNNISTEIDRLRSHRPPISVKYDCRNDPEAWNVIPSPHECKPDWTFPEKRPLITYNSVCEIMKRSNINEIKPELAFPIPARNYYIQRSDKWYKRGPECCPQPSCSAPHCKRFC
ncbi:uncharacterized protein LOC122509847 [Leptopilina heterotoma]|uniref:uncharacterized protein LOC122509847 n=1 Tax=Leptopilina heterotoma TaxID=63436 RepID=UPI001CA889E0|nr:uncharacterized protein LOC122509847 [Leptopilina heterotoma]XP_043480056.1 uncharacterized protein LOC122509847 [Leptopilina heterotoma]XP_043480057.1 uncharacterized protein LOC122509847 [Leptopilina heterotoma]XP_043480058.1 uncharacterized protein LOC122509847 [Leptopilina heterotoma]